MQIHPTRIPDILIIEPKVFPDARGFFKETWHQGRFRDHGCDWQFVQENHSRSVQGTIRGLHYQLPQPQGKLVQVICGAVWDVAVDLRRSSPTFGQWVAEVLSETNHLQLWIPVGFAHGFYTLSEHADLVYKCTAPYAAEHNQTLQWDDPTMRIAWPVPRGVTPLLSAKDRNGLRLAEAATFE